MRVALPAYSDGQMYHSNPCDAICDTLDHKLGHYAIVEALQGCDYLLVHNCCKRTRHSLEVAGIKIFTIPGFIKQPSLAVKHFIVADYLAKHEKEL